MPLLRRITQVSILLLIFALCIHMPASAQTFPWSWQPASPFKSINQFPLHTWPLSNYFPYTGQFYSSGWPSFHYPPAGPTWSAQLQPLPWSWPSSRPFPNFNQIPLYNWPQSGYFPIASLSPSSGWPAYSPPSQPPMPMEITLIHIGDLHGHLIPRAHLRGDGMGLMRGGLARMYTKIMEIRRRHPYSLLVNCGDTIQGSAEALYTEGSAMTKVLAPFKIDAFAPGNWDYLYGTKRFRELFADPDPIAPWSALASNLYYDGEPYAALTGQRVLKPYKIKYINGLKVGILGFTTHFIPGVLPRSTGRGFRFSQGDAELVEFIPILRQAEKVDLLVMISELGLARNIRLAEAFPGIDVILSSDLHEETWEPVITSTGTIIVEEGTDGTLVGELTVQVAQGRVANWSFTQHIIDTQIPEDSQILQRIAQVRMPFVNGPDFRYHVNPINGTLLKMPIDTIIGQAAIGLYRSNFSQQSMPGVVEGSSHDFITDVFRTMAQADIGTMQGFRFGTHVPPGPIKLEDIYHFIPFGPFIARGEVTGQQIKLLIENSTDSTLNPDVTEQGGGWLLGWSGLTYDLDPYALLGQRAQNVMVLRWQTNTWQPLDPSALYSFTSTNFAENPEQINNVPAINSQVLIGGDGAPMDATELVIEYLKTHVANPELNRIRLLRPLPPYRYGNPEVQPLWGAQP